MKTISDCLPETFESLGLTEKLKINRLYYYWDTIVGATVSSNCFIISIKPPLIVLGVSSSPWMQQLLMQKSVVINKVNDFYGEKIISDIQLQLRNHKTIKSHAKVENSLKKSSRDEEYINVDTIVLSKEEVEHFRTTTSQVKQEKLRDILFKVGVANAKKRKLLISEGYKKCPSCNTLIEPNETHCSRCIYRKKRQRIGQLKKKFYLKPYGNYEEICKLFHCSGDEYAEAKREMIYHFLNIIYLGGDTEYDRHMAAMLITGKYKDNLTEEFIKNMTDKYRRKSFSK